MITTGGWPDALEPIARKNYEIGRKKVPFEQSVFYNVRKGSKLTETFMEIGGLAPMTRHNGTVNYADITEGFKFTATAVQYSQGIKIERRFVDTDQQEIVAGLPKHLGGSVHDQEASDVFFPFNNAFNASITTLDSLQICSSAHTSNNGGSTQSNLGSTALGPVAVEATRIAMRKFLTNVDRRFDVNPDTILVPDDLMEPAYEIIAASGKVDTAVNNPNFHKGKYNVINSRWLNDTNNWFMIDSSLMKEMMEWSYIVRPEFNQDQQFDDYSARYSAYMHYLYVVKDWRFLFGQNVS